MLVDVALESNKIENLVLGVGINFNVNVKQIEKSLKGTSNFYGVASLSNQKQKIKPIQLVQMFLVELEKIYNTLNEKQTKKDYFRMDKKIINNRKKYRIKHS